MLYPQHSSGNKIDWHIFWLAIHMKNKEPRGETVRKVTSRKNNNAIDEMIISNIREYAEKSDAEISQRIEALDKEWDIERVLDLTMSLLALLGISGSLIFYEYSIALPMLLLFFFIWHAFQGWCPPIPLLRYFKIRTRPEIDREKYALKAMRGDFHSLNNGKATAEEAFKSVKKI